MTALGRLSRGFVRFIDRRLQKRYDIRPLSDDPTCVFKAHLHRTDVALPIPGGTIEPGSEVLELHFWNERLPLLERGKARVSWGVRGRRLLLHSLAEVAGSLARDPRFREVAAVGGSSVVFKPSTGSTSLLRRLGFEVSPAPASNRGKDFFENLYAWMLMWAFNRPSLENHPFKALSRYQVWMTRDQFLERYLERKAAKKP